MKRKDFLEGLRSGIPIALGYLSVSFSFGMLCITKGVPILSAVLTSMTNVTSAGQAAGLLIMAVGGSFLELAACQLIINLRYALMSLTVSQRLGPSVTLADRFFISFGITDEIFAVMASRREPVTKSFFAGLFLLPYFGWALGTLLGAACGNILPENITAVLGIALYGMFIAIIIPPAREDNRILICVLIAAALSCLIYFVPLFSFISSGTSVIICAVIASGVCAALFPIKKEGDHE